MRPRCARRWPCRRRVRRLRRPLGTAGRGAPRRRGPRRLRQPTRRAPWRPVRSSSPWCRMLRTRSRGNWARLRPRCPRVATSTLVRRSGAWALSQVVWASGRRRIAQRDLASRLRPDCSTAGPRALVGRGERVLVEVLAGRTRSTVRATTRWRARSGPRATDKALGGRRIGRAPRIRTGPEGAGPDRLDACERPFCTALATSVCRPSRIR